MNDRPELMTMDEVADFYRVKRQTIQGWVSQGHLRQLKVGPGKNGAVRFRREDVEALLETGAAS